MRNQDPCGQREEGSKHASCRWILGLGKKSTVLLTHYCFAELESSSSRGQFCLERGLSADEALARGDSLRVVRCCCLSQMARWRDGEMARMARRGFGEQTRHFSLGRLSPHAKLNVAGILRRGTGLPSHGHGLRLSAHELQGSTVCWPPAPQYTSVPFPIHIHGWSWYKTAASLHLLHHKSFHHCKMNQGGLVDGLCTRFLI